MTKIKPLHLFFAFCCTLLLGTPSGHAEVSLPHILSDHAVLQRDMPIHIWGMAAPAEAVKVSFHQQEASTVADTLGYWSVYLKPETAGGPYTLTIAGTNTLTVSDLLVGDVWFASGQSNMEIPLKGFPGSAVIKDAAREIASANHPNIRLLHIPQEASPYEQRDQPATWTLCTPDTATPFSAVAYFFGREIEAEEHVPVGLIDASWGGTPVSAWISLDALSSDASLMPEFAAHVPMVEDQADVPALAAEEKREDAAAAQAGKPAPKHPWHPDPRSWTPDWLFNGMVAPATPYTIRGVLWYQGETDSSAERAPYYEHAFPALITDWRAHWNEGDFPFLFVQISSFTSTPAETWGIVRAAQRRTLRLANTGMAVSLDVGVADNVHPPDKQTVAHRLALAAEVLSYRRRMEWSGPLFRSADVENGAVRVWFTHGNGLAARGGALEGFEVAAQDGHFTPAVARIEDGSVLVSAGSVQQPAFVRYAWANDALTANLYNSAGLPASTFTSQRHLPQPCSSACGR